MSTPAATPPLPGDLELTPEEEADTRAVIEKLMTGKPLDPEVYRRIRERSARISEDIFKKHGLLNVGVPAIRSLRDGEDE
jgi:hypothetical protein